jgi:murein DD-endopeptidase MepM/ murein hydrolase activator NlpD
MLPFARLRLTGKQWTIVVVPHGTDRSRTFEVQGDGLKLVLRLAAGIAGCAVLSLSAGTWYMAVGRVPVAERRLQGQVSALRDTIAVIGKRDAQIRLLAGLPAGDSEVASGSVRPAGAATDVDGLIVQANNLSASFAEVSTALERNSARMERTPSIMPTAGWLSSEFSKARFHPILHVERPHEGIDVAAPYGAPVVAPAAGDVMRISRQTGYGLVLEIDHGNGITTKYAHLSRVVVHPGQHVTRGDLIAAVGNSGLSTGPHLHYEIHVNGQVVDPLTYVLPGAIPD